MTVHRSDEGTKNAAADAAARAGTTGDQTAGTNAGAEQSTSRAGSKRSVFNINSRLIRPVDRATTGETVQKFVEAFTNAGKRSLKTNFSNDFQIIVIDSNSDQVALSAILICYRQQHQGRTHVGVFTLLVEGSGQNSLRTNRFVPIGGKQVEIEIAPGDVFNQTMWDRIMVKVQSVFGAGVVMHNSGCDVLPVELNPEDDAHIHRVFYNATAALFTILDVELNRQQEPFSVDFIDRDALKTANLDYNPLPIDNAVGLPVRSDLSITLRASKSEQGMDLHEQSVLLSRLDGYVDLVYQKPDMVQQGWGQAVPTTQHYYPRYVITRADTEIDALTPELHLLTISTASMLWTSRAWMSAFLPRYTNSYIAQLRDLGAVGYEVNLTGDPNQRPDRINTRDEAFTNQSLLQLIQATIRDKLIISMDIPERGEQSWLARNYIEAANGTPEAIRGLVQAADNLTDKHFSRIFQQMGGTMIARDDMNRIHMGYWRDDKGEMRDIRDFDYLAVLNRLAAVDPQAPVDWSATFDNLEIPLEMRLEKRAHFLRSLSNETFRLKGFARRITFTYEFIAALNAACAAAGLTVRPQNISTDLVGSAGRAQYDVNHVAYAGAPGGGMFSYDANPYGARPVGIPNTFFGTWGAGGRR